MFVQYGTGSKSLERLQYKACLMFLPLDAQSKQLIVHRSLFRFGFGYVWQNNGVQAIHVFVRNFKQRLIDNRWQDWNNRIDASDMFSFYRQFKLCYSERYLIKTRQNNMQLFIPYSTFTRMEAISNNSLHKCMISR